MHGAAGGWRWVDDHAEQPRLLIYRAWGLPPDTRSTGRVVGAGSVDASSDKLLNTQQSQAPLGLLDDQGDPSVQSLKDSSYPSCLDRAKYHYSLLSLSSASLGSRDLKRGGIKIRHL